MSSVAGADGAAEAEADDAEAKAFGGGEKDMGVATEAEAEDEERRCAPSTRPLPVACNFVTFDRTSFAAWRTGGALELALAKAVWRDPREGLRGRKRIEGPWADASLREVAHCNCEATGGRYQPQAKHKCIQM